MTAALAVADRMAEAAPPDDVTVGISVVVPVTERPGSLEELYVEYAEAVRRTGHSFEFLFVTEPWFRHLLPPLRALAAAGEPVRVLEVGQGVGETSLLRLATEEARGRILLTLPCYRRVVAGAIPDLIERVERGADLALAVRTPRTDAWINRAQNRLFHAALRWLGGIQLRDVASGVRAMRRPLMQELPLYGDFARFLPVLAHRSGYRVEEVPTPQHAADRSARLYRPGVYARRVLDLLGLFFLLRFTEKPLRFFGLLGSSLAATGALTMAVLMVQRAAGKGIADRPLLLLGVLLVVLGAQAIALGLIGEIIVHLHAPFRRPYRLSRE